MTQIVPLGVRVVVPPSLGGPERSEISVASAGHVIRQGHRIRGAVSGLLDGSAAERVVAQLGRGVPRPLELPQTLWVAVAVGDDGAIRVATSNMAFAGACYSLERAVDRRGAQRQSLTVGSGPDVVIELRDAPTELNQDFMQRFVALSAPTEGTPYRDVHRLPAGATLTWLPGRESVSVSRWLDPDDYREPDLRGQEAVTAYRETVEEVLSEVLPQAGTITSHVSGGLDSSFITASLARRGAAVLALNHRPLPEARLDPRGRFDPDDSRHSAALARRYPNLTIQPLLNRRREQPLDAAADAARRSWWPTFNPGNQVWLSHSFRVAAAAGAQGIFVGQRGNASFSASHDYTARYLLARGELAEWGRHGVRRGRAGGAWPWRAAIRAAKAAAPFRHLQRRPQRREYGALVGLHPLTAGNEPTLPTNSRASFLSWLLSSPAIASARHLTAHPVASIDVFQSGRILDVAARIHPATWDCLELPRGLARVIGRDRVPDEIRLRSRRGGQSWDSWFVVSDRRAEYLSRFEEAVPVLRRWLDTNQLQVAITELPWGDPLSRPGLEFLAINRVLAAAEFCRATERRLKDPTTRKPEAWQSREAERSER